ncbi:hypothetical protein [Limosilactobacillus reuteri]|uniref:hypothetical protein n=1 Tax=Limosilactobacillus reuteri TaxID=1598 RepID=UPI002B05E6F1|nr:hypothetical protein [Limosilactobacillus reuteri]
MDDIVFTIEISDAYANKKANKFLEKGWKLLSVGSVCVDILDNGQADYEMAYVLGANAKQYSEYKKEFDGDTEQDVKDFLENN